MCKRVLEDKVFLGVAVLLLGISLRLHPWEIPQSSPASLWKTQSFCLLLLRGTHSSPGCGTWNADNLFNILMKGMTLMRRTKVMRRLQMRMFYLVTLQVSVKLCITRKGVTKV